VADFLHERRDFDQLLAVVANDRELDPILVEKDYWIMHSLWGLQAQGFVFELKGGTSLSKGFGVIHRFSEDIDIRIEPPADMDVKTGRNQDKPAHIDSRRAYYAELSKRIRIPGIESVERDTFFDDEKMRSAGIRLVYSPRVGTVTGLKDGILLELGFDDTAPNRPVTISSWALDFAISRRVKVFDNRATDVPCYAPTHTFVEKLQTISTKYRRLAEAQKFPGNFLRHYYDVYCLLELQEVQEFLNLHLGLALANHLVEGKIGEAVVARQNAGADVAGHGLQLDLLAVDFDFHFRLRLLLVAATIELADGR
jgi:hypothetical protein